ncbi:MAG TPA: cytochrome C, partial [Verrucomicrobiales bacterium]|nr:cytochrome C [Verrucomicrobiales bacterium]
MITTRLIAVVMLVFAGISIACPADHSVLQVFESHCVKCHGKNGKTKGK